MPTLQRTDCRTISAGRIAWRTVLPCRNRRWTVRRIPVMGTTRAVRVRMRVHRHSVHRLGPPSHPQRSATADAYRNGVAAGCGIVWHRGVESSWSRSALRADSLRVLFRTLTHLERWHGRRRHQTRVHSRIAAWLAWPGRNSSLDRSPRSSSAVPSAWYCWPAKRSTFMEASPLGHPCCSAHGLAFSPAYQSPHYTCNSPDLRNASAYKTHIYKERP